MQPMTVGCSLALTGLDAAGAHCGGARTDDEARVIYDDDMEEWLALPQEALPMAGAPRAVRRRHARAAGGDAHSRACAAAQPAIPR